MIPTFPDRRRPRRLRLLSTCAAAALATATGCGPQTDDGDPGAAGRAASETDAGTRRAGRAGVEEAGRGTGTHVPEMIAAVAGTLESAGALADSIEGLLQPVALLRRAQEAELRRYSNAENLARARSLGARAADSVELAALVTAGRLVRLEDSTAYWVVRELDDSRPYVTPDARALLVRLGRAFHQRLGDLGLPPFRFEVSSALRTGLDQASLRGRNVNAASGASAHEFGTTVDLAYSGYAAPAELPSGLVPEDPEPLRPHLETIARRVLERTAARKSRELQAILGAVLTEAQARGEVLVTLERLQPVYHITVGTRLDP